MTLNLSTQPFSRLKDYEINVLHNFMTLWFTCLRKLNMTIKVEVIKLLDMKLDSLTIKQCR